MPADAAFKDRVMAILSPRPGVTSRPMFGGFGIFAEKDMFALISGSALFLKADDSNRAVFENAGSKPYGKMPYYLVPESVLADEAQFLAWADRSIAIAHARAKQR